MRRASNKTGAQARHGVWSLPSRSLIVLGYVVAGIGAVCLLLGAALLAGAVAYYALLSLVPLLLLSMIALSHVIDRALLLDALERYLGWLLPGEGAPVMQELVAFIDHREVVGWVLLATMLFFSSLAFSVLENAMSIIFHHRVVTSRRPVLISILLPYAYIVALGAGLLLVDQVEVRVGVGGQAPPQAPAGGLRQRRVDVGPGRPDVPELVAVGARALRGDRRHHQQVPVQPGVVGPARFSAGVRHADPQRKR